MGNAPDILDTQSPYWLRLYGHWIHLQGIMPVNDVEPQRAFSELVTVDGYRYEQRAPRGPRSWELPYRFGTAAATAALESAAYDVALNDAASGLTLFLDTNQAKVNMLQPDIPAEFTSTVRPILNAGGVWQPSYVGGFDVFTETVPVRAGVTYTLSIWTTAPNGNAVIILNDGVNPPILGAATGTGTPAAPELVTITYTPVSDTEVTINGFASGDNTRGSAGLMFFEGDCEPEHFRRGRRMPCEVSVHDPKITNNLIWRYCDPCKLPREHAVFTVNEVGTFPATVSA